MMENSDVFITLLSDNHAASGLEAEHGFSLWIQVAGRKILFDTGCGSAWVHNVDQLGISLETVDDVVLSHGHYDHTGGLAQVLRSACQSRLYLHPDAVKTRYSIHEHPRKIGMPADSVHVVQALSAHRVNWMTEPTEVTDGVWATGCVPRITAQEDTGGPFFDDSEGTVVDFINDDQSIWIETDRGLVVCLGCCHAGVINTLSRITAVTGQSEIHAVIGGMHLVHADAARIDWTIAAFRRFGVSMLMPCHCTGDFATERINEQLGEVVQSGFAGQRLHFAR